MVAQAIRFPRNTHHVIIGLLFLLLFLLLLLLLLGGSSGSNRGGGGKCFGVRKVFLRLLGKFVSHDQSIIIPDEPKNVM